MNADQPDLIPLRALNQVTYCPRLYYLEYVESVMPINEYVEDGLFQHRRVNDPALANRARREGDVVRTRSVSLSSERLGITGKLDLLEEQADVACPIETKRSAAPKDEAGEPSFYENDAIQLCAQGLLIEESQGVAIAGGMIYYVGSKARVDVPFDEALRSRTLAAIALVRDLAARDIPPEPLPPELRHRCFGCSLAPVCLPEETLYLIQNAEEAPVAAAEPLSETAAPSVTLTRVIPHSDDRAVLYLQENGSHVGKRGEHLVVSQNGRDMQRVPIVSVRQVVVFGNVQVSTQALQTLAAAEVPIVYLNTYGKFIATVLPAPPKNVSLRAAQYQIFANPSVALTLARAVVAAKIANQRTLLMRSLRSQPRAPDGGDATETDGGGPGIEASVEPTARAAVGAVGQACGLTGMRASDEPAARDMAEMLGRVANAPDPGVLLGLEGQSAAVYFGNFGRMLKAKGPGSSFDFTTRNRRPPRDPVNALLSFAYALLTKDCFSAVCTVGFDPYQGFYHTGRHGRPSLALDLVEEFRPVIADSVVLTLINNGMLVDGDFLRWRDACHLTDAGRKTFFEVYEQRKATEVTHPVFGYKMSYGRMLEVQARMLAGFVRGDIPQYVGFTVR
jgi:CRISP-associated protein Cas1